MLIHTSATLPTNQQQPPPPTHTHLPPWHSRSHHSLPEAPSEWHGGGEALGPSAGGPSPPCRGGRRTGGGQGSEPPYVPSRPAPPHCGFKFLAWLWFRIPCLTVVSDYLPDCGFGFLALRFCLLRSEVWSVSSDEPFINTNIITPPVLILLRHPC